MGLKQVALDVEFDNYCDIKAGDKIFYRPQVLTFWDRAYDIAKNQITSTAKFSLTNHVIPAAKYTEMQEYLDAVAKAQNKKLVIRRKV